MNKYNVLISNILSENKAIKKENSLLRQLVASSYKNQSTSAPTIYGPTGLPISCHKGTDESVVLSDSPDRTEAKSRAKGIKLPDMKSRAGRKSQQQFMKYMGPLIYDDRTGRRKPRTFNDLMDEANEALKNDSLKPVTRRTAERHVRRNSDEDAQWYAEKMLTQPDIP